MKFPWTKTKSAPLDELQEQLRHAEQAHSESITAVHAAELAFDDAGDDTAAKALIKAREGQAFAAEHLARARRLVADSEAKQAAAEQAADEERRSELEAELATDPEGDRLAAAEVEAWLAVVAARLDRRDHALARRKLAGELHALRMKLGEPSTSTFESVEPSTVPIFTALRGAVEGLPHTEPRAAIVHELLLKLGAANLPTFTMPARPAAQA